MDRITDRINEPSSTVLVYIYIYETRILRLGNNMQNMQKKMVQNMQNLIPPHMVVLSIRAEYKLIDAIKKIKKSKLSEEL